MREVGRPIGLNVLEEPTHGRLWADTQGSMTVHSCGSGVKDSSIKELPEELVRCWSNQQAETCSPQASKQAKNERCQPDLTAIRTYFMRWLIRTTSLV